jgi:UDP-GlcNAc:undecaprenyl-phosphate GlcNAc-1-phosphate transferase
MTFPINVYMLALAGGFLFSLLALPVWRGICTRIGMVDDPGHRKIHTRPIPLAGGFSVLTGMVIPLLVGAILAHWNSGGIKSGHALLEYGLSKRAWELEAIILGAFGIVVTGALDDYYELRPAIKFAGQFAIAALVASAHVRITLFVNSTVFSYAITILWILTVINALNFMDNMNGLCAGLGVICAGFFGVIAGLSGQYLVAGLAFLAAGALLGFLPHNFPKATAFLGDTGSHLVGYLLAVMAILPHFYTSKHPHPWAVLAPLLVLAVPLGDLAWVVCLRSSRGQPFYQGDTNHLSHRLVKRGWSQPKAVLLIWLASALAGALALAVMFWPA